MGLESIFRAESSPQLFEMLQFALNSELRQNGNVEMKQKWTKWHRMQLKIRFGSRVAPVDQCGPVWTSGPVEQVALVEQCGGKWQLQVEGSFGRLTTQTMCGLDVSAEGNQWRTELRVKVNVTAKSGP